MDQALNFLLLNNLPNTIGLGTSKMLDRSPVKSLAEMGMTHGDLPSELPIVNSPPVVSKFKDLLFDVTQNTPLLDEPRQASTTPKLSGKDLPLSIAPNGNDLPMQNVQVLPHAELGSVEVDDQRVLPRAVQGESERTAVQNQERPKTRIPVTSNNPGTPLMGTRPDALPPGSQAPKEGQLPAATDVLKQSGTSLQVKADVTNEALTPILKNSFGKLATESVPATEVQQRDTVKASLKKNSELAPLDESVLREKTRPASVARLATLTEEPDVRELVKAQLAAKSSEKPIEQSHSRTINDVRPTLLDARRFETPFLRPAVQANTQLPDKPAMALEHRIAREVGSEVAVESKVSNARSEESVRMFVTNSTTPQAGAVAGQTGITAPLQSALLTPTIIREVNESTASSAVPTRMTGPRQELIDDVQAQVQRFVALRAASQGQMTLQLHPRELGRLDIDFRHDAGEVQVQITSREIGTREILESNLPKLRASLAELGVTLGDVDVAEEREHQEMSKQERDANLEQEEASPNSQDRLLPENLQGRLHLTV